MKSAKDRMDIISAYQQLGSYRATADACGTTHRTVKKVVDKFEADQAGVSPQPRAERSHNYDSVAELVAERVEKSRARISRTRGPRDPVPLPRNPHPQPMDEHPSGLNQMES